MSKKSMIPLRIQTILLDFLGVPHKHKRCRSYTKKEKLCSKNRVNGSFFCRFHSNSSKLKACRTFAQTIIVLCDMLRTEKYGYRYYTVPEPKIDSRVSVRFRRRGGDRSIFYWFSGKVKSYKYGKHEIMFDDGTTSLIHRKTKKWIYSNTFFTDCCQDERNRRAVDGRLKQDIFRLTCKYNIGSLEIVNWITMSNKRIRVIQTK